MPGSHQSSPAEVTNTGHRPSRAKKKVGALAALSLSAAVVVGMTGYGIGHAASPGGNGGGGVTAQPEDHHDTSPPLRDLKENPGAPHRAYPAIHHPHPDH